MTHQQAIDGYASERYLLGEMSEGERDEFEAHYFDCHECAEDVRLGEMIRQEARRTGSSTVVTAEPVQGAKILTPSKWRRPLVAMPWAAAAALAVIASYQSFVTVPALRDAMTSQPLAPIMLREATRGAAPVVKVAPNQRFVTLAADVVVEPDVSSLRYEVLDSMNAPVARGEAPVPMSGTPLMLLIPVDELRSGRYSLIVRSVAQSAVLGEYQFDVSY